MVAKQRCSIPSQSGLRGLVGIVKGLRKAGNVSGCDGDSRPRISCEKSVCKNWGRGVNLSGRATSCWIRELSRVIMARADIAMVHSDVIAG